MYVCVCARAADCRSSTAERREVGLVHSRADGTRGTSWAGRSARCTATTATAATTPFTTTTPLTTTTTAAAATAALEPTAGTGRFDVAQVNLEQVLFLALALALGLFAGGGLDVHVAVVITNEGLGGLPLLVRLAALVRLARGLDAELVRLVLVPLGNVFSIGLVLFLGGGALGLLLRFGGGFSLFLLGNGLAEPLVLVLGRAVFLAPTALNGLGGVAVMGSVTGKKKKKTQRARFCPVQRLPPVLARMAILTHRAAAAVTVLVLGSVAARASIQRQLIVARAPSEVVFSAGIAVTEG